MLCRRSHAAAAVGQVDDVEVHLKHLSLVRASLQIQSAEHLGQLAVDADAVVTRQILDQLLGNGGCAERSAALAKQLFLQISDRRLARAQKIHALVLPESLVLNSHKGIDHGRGDLVDRRVFIIGIAAAKRAELAHASLSCRAVGKIVHVQARGAAVARHVQKRVVHATVGIWLECNARCNAAKHGKRESKHQQNRRKFQKFFHASSRFSPSICIDPPNRARIIMQQKK